MHVTGAQPYDETTGKQLLVKVDKDFMTTTELAVKVSPKCFAFGQYLFKKAVYRLFEGTRGGDIETKGGRFYD